MEFAKVSGKNVVIKLPIDILVCAFNGNPENYDEFTIKNKKKFAQSVADYLNNSEDQESGLTLLQETLDQIFVEMIENAEEFIRFPKEEEY